MPFPATIDLNDIALGSGGFKIRGDSAGDSAGRSVSAAGDVNGDGIGDLIVGAAGMDSGGAAYVLFGRAGAGGQPVDLDKVADGSGGFMIHGRNAGDLVGPVSAAGDVNGDGIDDLVVGAMGDDDGGSYAGAAYVVFGRTGGFTSPVTFDGIEAGSGGFKIQGQSTRDLAGVAVSAAGDINGDGIGDLVVGAYGEDGGGSYAGAAYVVFGRSGGFDSPVDLDDIAAGSGGFKIQGEDAGDYAGRSVSAAGDINGDGIDDLIVGAYGDDGGGSYAGAAYVVFGKSEDFASTVNLTRIAAGSGGFKIQGQRAGDYAGLSVAAAGDVNGDGIDDLVVGASKNDEAGRNAGAAYVVFGKASGFVSPVDLDRIAAGTGGLKILAEAEGDGAGRSVSAAGDVNDDGIGDLIVGAPANDGGGSDAGAAYLVFGRSAGFATPIDLADIADGSGGFKIQGQKPGDGTGLAVAAAGDVNGDGIDDLIVGAAGGDVGGLDSGAAYVIFGRPDVLFTNGDNVRDLRDLDLSAYPGVQATRALAGDDVVRLSDTQNIGVLFAGGHGDDSLTGSSQADLIQGDTENDSLYGGGGGDTLSGNDDDDSLAGASGADRLHGGNDADAVFGGADDDRLLAGRGNDHVNGGSGDDRIFGQTGNDQISGANGNDMIDGGAGNDNLYGQDGDDTLVGGSGLDVLTGGNGADVLVYTSIDDREDRINGFEAGPGGDVIDLSLLLRGFTTASDPADFVNLDHRGSHTYVQVNPNGGGNSFVDLTILKFVTGLVLDTFIADGNLDLLE